MSRADFLAVYYLFWFCIVLPWLAWRSRQKLRAGAQLPSRTRHFQVTIVMLILFGVFSIVVGRFFRILFFPRPNFDTLSVLLALLILALMCGTLPIRARLQTPQQRERMKQLQPQTRSDMFWWTIVSLTAGIFEEITYRSVIFACFWWYTGNALAAALISAIVFAISHVIQGPLAMSVIFLFALAVQGLCWLSGSLYLAMGVHFLYDLFAGFFYQRRYGSPSVPPVPAAA